MPHLQILPGADFADRADRYDLVVVGSGIVGLAHASEAHSRGMTVAVVERSAAISGASVRNFGHVGVTAQSGIAYEYGQVARSRWEQLSVLADFWLSDAGTIVVARTTDELALLEEFRATRDGGDVVLLSPERVAECSPVAESTVVGGAWLTRDLQVDPRTAAPRIAEWLAGVGVDFFWRTTVLGVEGTGTTGTTVHTARGDLRAGHVIVAVNHDIDGLYPGEAAAAEVERCTLEMMSVSADLVRDLASPLLTGFSMVRYSGLASLPSAARVRAQLAETYPALVPFDVNQMYTQRPGGDLIVGDTHAVGAAASPFQSEAAFDGLLEITTAIFGVTELTVRERWQGVYAKGNAEFLRFDPSEHVTVASVTAGIGMSTGLGFAASVMAERFGAVEEIGTAQELVT
ncbi:TIGR03364 family FAD-dependent oxidoreductase [soil metagenome]